MRIFMFILALAFVPSVSAAVNAVPNFNIGANCKAEIAKQRAKFLRENFGEYTRSAHSENP